LQIFSTDTSSTDPAFYIKARENIAKSKFYWI